MSTEVVKVHRFRSQVPDAHRESLDTRILWLWHQRFGTIQTIYSSSPDILDVTAATLILQAVMARDLKSIQQLFNRLEGSPQMDDEVRDREAALRV